VLEIVRPGMEDSESAEKQENTGIGPASACRGESAFTRVFHPLWMEVVASPSCAGRSASKTRVNALMTRASIFFAKRILRRWMDCRVKPGNDGEGVVPAKAGTHDHRRWLWVPALAALGRDDIAWGGRSTNLRLCEMRSGAIPLFRIDINNENCNSNVFGRRAHITPICHPRCGTIRRDPMCHHRRHRCGTISRHHPS
jgi:hypothetical protein